MYTRISKEAARNMKQYRDLVRCLQESRSSVVRKFSSKNRKLHSTTLQNHSTAAAAIGFNHGANNVGLMAAAAASQENVPRPSFHDLRTLFVASAIPMVGFGFMDNLVMIQAGQYIDSTLGVQLGLATLTAAAAGQVVSDVSGVVFGGTLERFLTRLSLLRSPSLTAAQRQLPIARNVSMAGAIVGVVVGCALGATTLLFMDLEARERIHRAQQLREIVTDMISDKRTGFNCDSCTVYVVGTGDYDLEHLRGSNNHSTTLEPMTNAHSPLVEKCVTERDVFVEDGGHILYAPIVKDDNVMAVLLFRHEAPGVFSGEDVHTARVMASHMAIFMNRIIE